MPQPDGATSHGATVAEVAPRQLLLSVWCPRPGEFTARALLADGSVRDFKDPF